MKHILLALLVTAGVAQAGPLVYEGTDGPGKGKHIVFLAGDHEYRSEESLPALARLLARHHGFKCTVLFDIDSAGEIAAGDPANMPGMEALDTADLMVVFLRFQNLPPEQMKPFDAYLRRGGPVVGLRTATHAFRIPADAAFAKYSFQSKVAGYEHGFGHQVLGQTWVGHYGRNHAQSTRITVVDAKKDHAILRGVKDVWVQAGAYVGKPTDGEVLTMAQPLNGMTPDSPPDAAKAPQPSEWTRSYKSESGKIGRVFTSLYGTSEDITNEGYRRLLVNGIFWSLGLEDAIKPDLNVSFVGPFKPNTFAMGKYAVGIKPEMYAGFESPIPANNNIKGSAKKDEPAPAAKKEAPTPPAKKEAPVAKKASKKSQPKPPAMPEAPKADVPADYRDPSPFAFAKSDVVAIVGNGLPDRFQHDGWLETLLQSELRGQEVRFRDMGVSGDRPDSYPRSKGATPTLEYLRLIKADVVLAFFGYNESFAGAAKADDHRRKLVEFVRTVRAAQPNGEAFPRIVLFSPIAYESTGNPNLPDGKEHNARLLAYTRATEAAAKEAGVAYVNLFHPSRALYRAGKTPLTINGVHLTEEGNRLIAEVIASALLGKDVRATAALEPLRTAVRDKNLHWWNRYRAADGNDIYGSRSTLSFVNGQTNADVLQHELRMLDVMTANRDPRIWAVAQGRDFTVDDSNVPAPIPVISNVGGGSKSSSSQKEGSLRYLDGQEAIANMAVAKGLKISLFADEKKFPQLVNPVQLQVDGQGRLWAAVWPTYPMWEPKKAMNDALLILHDDDGDGSADRVTEFAKVQNPLGFEFWNGGVLVTCQSELIFLKDTNGDDKADVRVIMLQGLDTADTHHGANNLIYGPDGAIYWQSGVFMQHNHEHPWGPSLNSGASGMYRFDPRRFTISFHANNGPNSHGIAFDYWGNHYATDGTSGNAFHIRPVPGGFKMFSLLKKEVRPVPACEILSSAHFPDSMQGDFLICNTIGFLGIKQYRLDRNAETGVVTGQPNGDELTVQLVGPDGKTTEAKSRGLMMSGDKNFRPTDAIVGADGALYIADWHNVIIGHMQHNVRDPNRDHGHGRIYRLVAEGRPLQAPVAIAGQPIPVLLDNLKHPVDGVRHRTRVELSGRPTKDVMAALAVWTKQFDPKKKEDAHHLLEALWLHQQHNVRNVELLEQLLASPEPYARHAAQTVKHLWFNVEATLQGGVITGAADQVTQKSGVLSDTPELTTIRVGTVPEKMRYDVTQLVVAPGKKVKLTFANYDFMPHNLLLVKPGKANAVGEAAAALGPKGFEVAFVPDSRDVLWATKLVDFGEEQLIEFTAPAEAGAYPYICSFPGHHLIMRGTLIVASNPVEVEDILKKNPELTAKITQWKLSDFDADLARVGQHRNYDGAKLTFTARACAQCHQLGKEGNAFGPKLADVVKKYKSDPKAILQEILEPSRTIEDKYRNVTVALEDDTFVAGLVLAEDKDSITIQDRPAPAAPRKIAKSSIAARRDSKVSIMPEGLLNTLSKEQILDLLAYVLAEGDPNHPAFKHAH